MNKRQKETKQAQLDAEKAVLKQLEAQYKKALEDINERIKILQSDELTTSSIYRIEHQKALKAQVEAILEKLHSDEYSTISQFLSEAYTDAFVFAAYDMFGQGVPLILAIDPKDAVRAILTDSKISEDLYTALGVDITKLKQSISAEISRGLASDMPYSEIARNIYNTTKAPMARAKTIVATEAHRIQEAAVYDLHKKAKSRGADIVRQWNSTLDGRTRDAHRRMDGQIVEVDEPFVMGGQKAMYPGNFGDPAQDCNCRCTVLQRARWALGADELKTLQQRAEFFGLDKTENLRDFEKKYLKAAEKPLENSQKSGKIKAGNTVVKDAISSGIVSTAINPNKQNRHIKDSADYIDGRSYLTKGIDEAQNLVDEFAGTGDPVIVNGEWKRKERIRSNDVIGVHVDPETGKETETKNGIIIYSKTGSHIVPGKE